jgi:hypothetical protein
MVGSYMLQMNLRSGRRAVGSDHGSTSAGAGHDPKGQGENGHENANGESHDAPTLGPSSSSTTTTASNDSSGDDGGVVGFLS